MKKIYILAAAGIMILAPSCRNRTSIPMMTSGAVNMVIRKMNDIMVHDVTNPPLAARFFAYTCLAGYEVVSQNEKQAKGMHGILNEYPLIEKPDTIEGYEYRLSALLAMMETASRLQPSGTLMIVYEKKFLDSCLAVGIGGEVIDRSKRYAQYISKKILTYAKADRYNKISNYPRYKLTTDGGYWAPTPPAYMMPVEPYFNTVRTLLLDSASQYKSAPPVPFSSDKGSAFYKLMLLNYKKCSDSLTQQEKNIANFWDCNPFAVQNEGHMLIGLKKISPGAHWMRIAGNACEQSNIGFSKTMEIVTILSVGMLDSFISCWDGKYSTNRIRPETAIRKYIDPDWKPLLQTPPFPEYTSGHSVVSATCAGILTHYFGDHFSYTDNVEVDFGVPPRNFSSFMQASNEAAVSRFLGGIHFMDAIDNGLIQGTNVGNLVLEKYFKN